MQAAVAAMLERFGENADRQGQPSPKHSIAEKVWLLLRVIELDGQASKKLGWQHAKYEVVKVLSPEVVELGEPGQMHKRYNVDMLLLTDKNLLPSQIVDYDEPVTILDKDGEEEFFIDEIIGCRTKNGKRQVLFKWTGMYQPELTSLSDIQDATASDAWEAKMGSAESNNGPKRKR